MVTRVHSKSRNISSATAIVAVVVILVLLSTVPARATDWMTWPSTYTHDSWGNRVDQHTLPVQPVGPSRNDVVRSGYRHFRSTLQAGQSADNYHITEQWGAPVVPYEHWRFPFRPFGAPYDAWGPPTPYGMFFGSGLNAPFVGPYGGAGYPGNGAGFPNGRPGYGFGFPLQPSYQNQPWFDGTHPDAPTLDNRTDREFFWKPQIQAE